MTLLQDRINELLKEHGTFRGVYKKTGLQISHLCNWRSGKVTSISDRSLKRLGLERVCTIQRIPKRGAR